MLKTKMLNTRKLNMKFLKTMSQAFAQCFNGYKLLCDYTINLIILY